MRLRGSIPGACLWLVAGAASAHPTPFSYVELTLGPTKLEGTVVVHVLDVAHDLHLARPDTLLDPATVAQESGRLAQLVATRLRVTADGQAVSPICFAPEVIADRQSWRLAIEFPLARRPGLVSIAGPLFPYDPKHQTFINIRDGEWLTQAMLDVRHATYDYFPGTRQGTLAAVRRFLPAGVRHILIGPDHLLFLAGLLLVGGSLRKVATIVTAFTVAHSVTLSLAALNILSPPARIIEPAIALSIVYVGAHNLWKSGGRDARTWIAFAFGFIHGFGFAAVLREIGLPARALAWSLFSFNLGVEIGQLCVVVVIAAALAALRVGNPARSRQVVVVGSAVVIAAGAFWFLQRAFFPGLA